MARCAKCLIIEGSEGALACQITGCPHAFGELTAIQIKRATMVENRPQRPETPDPIVARLSPHQIAGHTPPKPGSRPRGRPRKVIEGYGQYPRTGPSVTVYDRDAGVGALPANLRSRLRQATSRTRPSRRRGATSNATS
jgi:hypothetical protein